ncbi:MAG: YraN family protein [Chloroflexota bacterium]|nr:YraN family protein [Chloroflexota bacterium]
MSDPRHALGLAAEAAVAAWLTSAGWTVLERRVRAPRGGEMDILALDPDRVLVGVEVRARRHPRAGSAVESIDRRRVDRLRRALVALGPSAPPHAAMRIDVVVAEPTGNPAATWRLRRMAGIDAP